MARAGPHLAGIADEHLHGRGQHVVDRFPIHAGALQSDDGTVHSDRPIAQGQELPVGGPKVPQLRRDLAFITDSVDTRSAAPDGHRCHNRLMDDLHTACLLYTRRGKGRTLALRLGIRFSHACSVLGDWSGCRKRDGPFRRRGVIPTEIPTSSGQRRFSVRYTRVRRWAHPISCGVGADRVGMDVSQESAGMC